MKFLGAHVLEGFMEHVPHSFAETVFRQHRDNLARQFSLKVLDNGIHVRVAGAT